MQCNCFYIWSVLRGSFVKTFLKIFKNEDSGLASSKLKCCLKKILLCVHRRMLQCWVGYLVCHVFFSRYEYINVVYICSHWLAMSNSCYNPFIYGIYSVSKRGWERGSERQMKDGCEWEREPDSERCVHLVSLAGHAQLNLQSLHIRDIQCE